MRQVSHIDVAKESPCGHGIVICFSVYCGEDVNFGESLDGQPADGIIQNQLWVDTMVDDAKDQVLQSFLFSSLLHLLWSRHILCMKHVSCSAEASCLISFWNYIQFSLVSD